MWSMLRGTGRHLSSSSRSNAKVTKPKKSGPIRYGASTRFSNLYRTAPLGARSPNNAPHSLRSIDYEFQNVPPSSAAPPTRIGDLDLARHVVDQCLSNKNEEDEEETITSALSGVNEGTITPTVESVSARDNKGGIFSSKKFSAATTRGNTTSSSAPSQQEHQPSISPQKINNRHVIKVYTDGACSNNGQANALAGCGVWFGHGDPRNISERLPGLKQTNIRGELFAAVRALEIAPMDATVALHIDCKYVINGMTEWVPNWIAKGTLDEKENSDLWRRLIELTEARGEGGVQWKWVKAHSGIVGNECADKLAVAGAKMRAVV